MPPPDAELPEGRARRCPTWQSEEIVPQGHVLAAAGLVKVEHRCETCGAAFFLVRKPLV